MKKPGLLLDISLLLIAGATFADPGGPQVCCPKQGTCTVNKLGGGPISEPVAFSAPESQRTPVPASKTSEQPS